MTNSVNTRELVLDLLLEINVNGSFSHISVGNILKKHQYLEKTERSFITRVTEGTMENLILIDYIIDQYSTVKVNKMKPVIKNILRMTVYQFLYMDSVPNAAAVNEAVKLTIKRGFRQLKGFVNGVLRNIERNLDNISYPNAANDLVTHLSVMYSVPKWIVEQWIYQYGTEEASRMIKASIEDKNKNRVAVRTNTLKTTDEEVMAMLESEGVTVEKTPYGTGLYIKNFDYISRIEAFRKGYISVQDISSMMVAKIAAPKEGDYCIDICAAPGGKSLHMCELMNGKGFVEARDLTQRKIDLIRENIDRHGAKNIEARISDALEYDNLSREKADVVIADLPCSGLGVIGKKSDIKYNMTSEKQNTLVKIQRDILKNALKYVKKGGYIVFSTCTTNKSENIDNFNWIKESFDYEPVDIEGLLPEGLKKDTAKNGYIQMLQGIDETDGFFIGKLKRKKQEG